MSGAAESAGQSSDPGDRRMVIRVDRDLCQGHGVCESEAPDVFRLEKKATTVTVLDETPPESARSAVEAAVKYCPTHALSIETVEQ